MVSFKDKDTNILFSDVTVGTALGGKYYNGNNGNFSDAATDEDLVDIASDYGGKLPTIVNAVEIDWNGMVLGDKTINTTDELLSN